MSSEKSDSSSGSWLSFLANTPKYLSESVDELKKVSTPTKQETMQATMGTLVIILFFALCLLVLDSVCHWLMGLLIAA